MGKKKWELYETEESGIVQDRIIWNNMGQKNLESYGTIKANHMGQKIRGS
jgi:hypothetical protein